MELKNQAEVENTRAKLKLLEERYTASKAEPADNPLVHELSLRSLKRMINQMTEEIVRYESRAASRKA